MAVVRSSIQRTQRWLAVDTGGEFVPLIPLTVTTATVDQQAALWPEQPGAWQQPPWFQPDTEAWTPLPFLTVATVGQTAPLWLEQPGQETPITQQWEAPDAAHAPPILTVLYPLDPALLPLYLDEQQQGRSVGQQWFAPDAEAGGVAPISAAPAFDPANGFDWPEQPQAWRVEQWFAPEAEARPTTFPKAAPLNLTVTPNLGFNALATVTMDWPAGLSQYDRITTAVRVDNVFGWTSSSQDPPSPSYGAPTTLSVVLLDDALGPAGAFVDVVAYVLESGGDQFGTDPVPDLGRPGGLPGGAARGYYTAVVRFQIFRPPTFQPDLSLQEAGLNQQWSAPDASVEMVLPNATFAFDPAIQRDWLEQPQIWQQPPWFAPDAEAGGVLPPIVATFDPRTLTFDDSSGQQDRSAAQQWFTPEPSVETPLPNTTFAFDPAVGAGWADQPALWQPVQWFAPDAELAPPNFPTLPVIVDISTPSTQAPLWIEQPQAWQQPPWYSPTVEPVDGPLQSWLFTSGGGGGGTVPAVLINAENGDVFLYIGGVFIVPAS